MSSPIEALKAGQVLYDIQDSTLITELDGRAWFQRVSFTGTGNEPKATVKDRMDIGPYGDIRSARIVTHSDGSQVVAILTKAGVATIGLRNGAAGLDAVQTVANALHIVGFDPTQVKKRSLALLAASDGGFTVVQLDLDNPGAPHVAHKLPPEIRGTVVAADLARCGDTKMLVVATITESAGNPSNLLVHAVKWDDLTPQVTREHVATLLLGNVLTSKEQIAQAGGAWISDDRTVTLAPFVDAHLARHNQVAAVLSSMRAKSSDQQLAVAWYGADGTCRIAVVGWRDGGKAAILAQTAAQDPRFQHKMPLCRLAAADLLHSGTDQLVLGFPTDRAGAFERRVALMLFTFDEPAKAAATLKCESTYLADPGGNDFANYDLHIGAGIFGTCAGVVQVIGTQVYTSRFGGGDTISEGFIVCGFVSVDPVRRGFPEMTGNAPGPARMAVATPPVPVPPGLTWLSRVQSGAIPAIAKSDFGLAPVRFHYVPVQWAGNVPTPYLFGAFSSDLDGQSVVLGSPQLVQEPAYAQILAIIQAHPFDRRFVKDNRPQVSFSVTESESQGLSVTSDASWTLSDDISISLGLGPLSLSKSVHNSYLKSLGKADDTTITKSVTEQESLTNADKMLVYELSYNIWRYPVVRGSASHPAGGEMLVIVPEDLKLKIDWVEASTYAYRPRSEVGMLLSYADLKKDGYQAENQLFALRGYDVVKTPDSTSITYDLSESRTQTLTSNLNISHSESIHAGLSGSTELFEYLPANFSLNVGTSKSYSQSKVEATHVNLHKGVSISIHSGNLDKAHGDYKYHVTPVIYQHDKLGCLMLAWDVSVGEGWDTRTVTAPQICLIRLYPEAEDEVKRAFSRSISFAEREDSVVEIGVEIFNNSLSSATNVSCEFFNVTGEFTQADSLPEDIKLLTKPEYHLAKVQLDGELKPVERRKVTLSGQKLAKPLAIAVKLSMGNITFGVYWRAYPSDKFLRH